MANAFHRVDPTRLQHGHYSHEHELQIGEGDISASYSADLVALQGRIRRPFTYSGNLYTCIGMAGGDRVIARVYRLTPKPLFAGDCFTYSEKTSDAAAARNDPQGFYHGIKVSHRGEVLVLTGPPITLIPGEVAQPSLFAKLMA